MSEGADGISMDDLNRFNEVMKFLAAEIFIAYQASMFVQPGGMPQKMPGEKACYCENGHICDQLQT